MGLRPYIIGIGIIILLLSGLSLYIDSGNASRCDEGFAYLPGEDVCFFKYEASRRDANSTSEGSSKVPVSEPENVPWTEITLEEAKDSCRRAGYRLITNSEWQAATGALPDNSHTFVHGNNNFGRHEKTGERCRDDPTHSSKKGGKGRCLTGTGPEEWESRYSVEDLNGNVWEWTSTRYSPGSKCDLRSDGKVAGWNSTLDCPTRIGESNQFGQDRYWPPNSPRSGHVVRGAAYQYGRDAGPFAIDLRDAPQNSLDYLGFRCAYTPDYSLSWRLSSSVRP